MSGLIEYGSSDEGEEPSETESNPETVRSLLPTVRSKSNIMWISQALQTKQPEATVPNGSQVDLPIEDTSEHSTRAPGVSGPVMGPPAVPRTSAVEGDGLIGPESPYTATRALIRDLTLPTVPNFDIPPSPPGSPPPEMDVTVARFTEAKKKGLHFNERLATNPSIKNPSLLSKIMQNIGMDESDQYASTLPTELWDPEWLPHWAHKEGLAKAQQSAHKIREEDAAKKQRDAIDFVPAGGSGQSSRAATPGSKTTSGKSAAERVMAGLARDRNTGGPGGGGGDGRTFQSPKRRK